MGLRHSALRSMLAIVAGAVVLLAGGAALLAFFVSRDDGDVRAEDGPGTVHPDRGSAHRAADPRGPTDAAGFPTSGPHRPRPIARDRRPLSRDQVLHALELGDVVLVYGSARPPRALLALQEDIAGPFDPDLAAAGSAVVLARKPGERGVTALAWRRAQRGRAPEDPMLRAFAERWLGRGAMDRE